MASGGGPSVRTVVRLLWLAGILAGGAFYAALLFLLARALRWGVRVAGTARAATHRAPAHQIYDGQARDDRDRRRRPARAPAPRAERGSGGPPGRRPFDVAAFGPGVEEEPALKRRAA